MDEGFVKGQSDNLPMVSTFMVTDFIVQNNNYNLPESKGIKQMRSCREEYGDSAVGYVQLKRDSEICIVKGRICPEHNVSNKAYIVEIRVNESEDIIESAECFSCAAAKGGCKHAIAFLMWCHRRSEEPSPTSVASYWQKPKLAKAVSSKEVVMCKDFMSRKSSSKRTVESTNFLEKVLSTSKKNHINSVLYETAVIDPMDSIDKMSVHFLAFKFFKTVEVKSFKNFISFSEEIMKSHAELCNTVFTKTSEQSMEPLWHSMRYGRITASRFKEATTCQTDGSLVSSILGARNMFTSAAMKRGRDLEFSVVKVLSTALNKKINKCGLKLCESYPLFGASADGITSDGDVLIEIKCPTSEKNISSNLSHGIVQDKVKLQMLLHGISKCILCVASPSFENDEKITFVAEELKMDLVQKALTKANTFYERFLFPKLKKIHDE